MGDWDLVVSSDGINATVEAGFEIKSFSMDSVIPNFGSNRQTSLIFVKGENFPEGATVKLARAGKSDVLAEVVESTGTFINATINLRFKSVSSRRLRRCQGRRLPTDEHRFGGMTD